MATFWERAAHRFTVCFLCILTGFEGGIASASVPGHCLSLTFYKFNDICIQATFKQLYLVP